jgi:pantoate--beta-alanine ligase
MEIITSPAQMHELCCAYRASGEKIGFVPTMGALHAGHAALLRHAAKENDRLIASIFVNPAQFGANEDLSRYPRTAQADKTLLQETGCDALFEPDVVAMYGGNDFRHGTWVDVTPFDELWEGVTRPGHLRGVATVVTKLFNIVAPHRAYFGEKDYQQLKVVQALVRDLNLFIEVVGVPTVREADGLALSSRNRYLSEEEREAAVSLSQALRAGADLAQSGECDVAVLGQCMASRLADQPLVDVQYLTIVEAESLLPLEHLDGREGRILVAAYVGQTRLIDNWPLPAAQR